MKRVLVIDDEPQIRKLLRISLEKKDFSVHEASTGFEGLQAIQSVRPDIILLDLNLPDLEGSKVLADIRSWSSIPVLIISVRNLEGDIVSLIDSGADDYLTKPFNVEELVARMNAALRRTRPELRESVVNCGNLKVDFNERLVSVEDREIHLTPTEFAILSFLAKNHGKIVTPNPAFEGAVGASRCRRTRKPPSPYFFPSEENREGHIPSRIFEDGDWDRL